MRQKSTAKIDEGIASVFLGSFSLMAAVRDKCGKPPYAAFFVGTNGWGANDLLKMFKAIWCFSIDRMLSLFSNL